MIIVGVAVAVLVVLAVVPIPQTRSFSVYSAPEFEGAQFESFPSGAPVSGHWSTAGGQSVTVQIEGGLSLPSYNASGSSGSFSFTANFAPYLFVVQSSGPVNTSFTVTYSAPLL